jgi:DNA-binding NarL/FixJ family response regulator
VAALAARREPAGENGHLTSREREIAGLLDQGLTNKEIAGRLFLSISTVKNHVHNILEKLGASTRGEAAARLRPAPPPRRAVAGPGRGGPP